MTSKTLKWQRIGKSYDLKLVSPIRANDPRIRQLLEDVKDSSANWRPDMGFSRDAYHAIDKWISGPESALPESAYALLSNWFLTSLGFIRESPRGRAALEMWKALFFSVPEQRLTDTKRNRKIRPESFALWWPKQQKAQRQGS